MTPERIAKDLARYNKIKAEMEQKRLLQLEELRKIKDYEEANLIEFFGREGSKLQPNPIQRQLLEAFLNPQFRRLLITGANRIGKGLVEGETVLRKDGFVAVESIRVGDVLFGSDGLPVVVSGVFDRGLQPCWRIFFDDRSFIDVDESHLWSVVPYNKKTPVVVSTKRIIDSFGEKPKSNRRYKVCELSAVQFPTLSVPIDPYLLGILIGDGSFVGTSITLSTADAEILQAFVDKGYVVKSKGDGRVEYIVHGLVPKIRELGLKGLLSYQKHIPKTYMINSKEVRLSVLRGLMDSDGYIQKRTKNVSFSTTSMRLAEDVLFLAQSLGGKGRIGSRDGEKRKEYRVIFRIKENPFFLKRKASVFSGYKRTLCRIMHRFEYIGEKRTFCLSTTAKDGLFVAKNFILTHNTTINIVIAFITMFGRLPWTGKVGDWRFKEKIVFSHDKPRKVRYIGQSWNDHIKKVVIPALEKWWPKNRKVKKYGNGIITDTTWIDENTGSVLEIMSNLQSSDVHEGDFYDIVIFDEPPKQDIWIANARGLTDRNGKAVFAMTLLKEAWVHRDIIKKANPDGTPDASVFHVDADIEVNVGYGLTRDGVDQFKSDLAANEDEYKARILGVPAYMAGLVLFNFSRAKHCVSRFKIPTDWIVDIAIDVHPKKPQAVLFNATSPQNMKYYCWEIWEHGDARFVADEIIRVVRKEAYRVGRVIIDPLAKSDSNSENSFFDIVKARLAAHGMYLETASKDKTSGIIEMNSNFQTPNGMPCQYLFSDLKRTIHDFEGWIYEDKGEEAGKPKKEDDDFCENAYRLALLGTQWTPPQLWVSEEMPEDRNASAVTGY